MSVLIYLVMNFMIGIWLKLDYSGNKQKYSARNFAALKSLESQNKMLGTMEHTPCAVDI